MCEFCKLESAMHIEEFMAGRNSSRHIRGHEKTVLAYSPNSNLWIDHSTSESLSFPSCNIWTLVLTSVLLRESN